MITVNPLPLRVVVLLAAGLLAGLPTQAQLGVMAATGADQPASSVLTSASATAAIQSCAFEARNQLFLDIENRLRVVEPHLGELTTRASRLDGAARDKYASALHDVKTQGLALKMAVASAQSATSRTWPEVRAALAFSYIDYVGAVSRAEKIVADAGKG